MNLKFEQHGRPLPSRLEQWREEITAMRTANWPYPRIAAWLLDQHQFQITGEAIRQFCKVREITKGGATTFQSAQSPTKKRQTHQTNNSEKKPKLFEYDSDKPIIINRK